MLFSNAQRAASSQIPPAPLCLMHARDQNPDTLSTRQIFTSDRSQQDSYNQRESQAEGGTGPPTKSDLNDFIRKPLCRFGTRILFNYSKPVLHYRSGTKLTYCFFSDVIAG